MEFAVHTFSGTLWSTLIDSDRIRMVEDLYHKRDRLTIGCKDNLFVIPTFLLATCYWQITWLAGLVFSNFDQPASDETKAKKKKIHWLTFTVALFILTGARHGQNHKTHQIEFISSTCNRLDDDTRWSTKNTGCSTIIRKWAESICFGPVNPVLIFSV